MIRRILDKETPAISHAAFILAVASIASRLLGIVRDRAIASTFGASQATDIYYASFRLPDLMFHLVVLGAISSAFIPVLSGYIGGKKEQEGWELASTLLNFLLIVLILLGVVLYFTMPWVLPGLIQLFEHGDSVSYLQDPGHLETTIRMTRIMLLSPIFLGVSSVVGGVLNVRHKFVAYSFAPVVYNVGIIVGALFLVPFFDIYGLAYGVVIGSFLHMIVQLPSVVRAGFAYRPRLALRSKGFVKVLRLMIPRTLSLAVVQFNLLVISFIAFSTAEGDLSVFNFAMNLQSFPLGVFAISFAIAALPVLSRQAHEKTLNSFIATFSKTFRQILYYVIPSSILFLVLRAQIVRVVLGAGQFDWSDTYLTAQALGIFALSLFAQGLIPLITRGFYAIQNTVIPFVIAVIVMATNIVLSLLFTGLIPFPFDVVFQSSVLGLVTAFTVSNIIHVFLLITLFHARVKDLDDARIVRSVMKVGVSAFLAGTTSYGALYLLAPVLDTRTGFGILLQGLLAGLLGIVVYVFLTFVMKSSEAHTLIHQIRLRLAKIEKWMG